MQQLPKRYNFHFNHLTRLPKKMHINIKYISGYNDPALYCDNENSDSKSTSDCHRLIDDECFSVLFSSHIHFLELAHLTLESNICASRGMLLILLV